MSGMDFAPTMKGVCEDVEENPYQRLARIFTPGAEEGSLCLGTVASWPDQDHPTRPHRVIAGGTSQEREDLLSSPGLLPHGLAAGDQVVLLPIEEKQRYIILCKAVKV